jgi:pimeloyl-ACP methyl ester carboxylesterase
VRPIPALALTSVLLAGLAASAHAVPSAPGPVVRLEPCTLPGVPAPVECGTVEVPEDRSRPGERTLGLRVVRLGATGPDPAPEALVVLLGGPGEAAAGAAPGIAAQFQGLRRSRDIVLFDQRGTGQSNPLDCVLYDGDLERGFGELLPPDALGRCSGELGKEAALHHYTTEAHADDLDAVREALGYERVDLHGTSYGTRAALVYLRRHGHRVRSVVLHGLHPPGSSGLADFVPAADAALEGVLGECGADADCAEAFPGIREQAHQVFRRLREAPRAVTVLHPDTGVPTQAHLNATVAGEAVRYMLYRPAWAGMLPVILHQAYHGDLSGLAEFAVFARLRMIEGPGNGLWISITCQEEVPRDGVGDAMPHRVHRSIPSEEDRLQPGGIARGSLGAGAGERSPIFDDHRAASFQRACDSWPHQPVDPSFHEPVGSTVPVLLLSGEWDPATPPWRAEVALETLPGGLHLVVPSAGHAFQGLQGAGCVDRLVEEFVVAGAHEGLDTGCLTEIRRPSFRVDPLPLRPAVAAPGFLDGLTGRYGGPGAPLQVEVEATPDGLRLELPNGMSFLTVPVDGGELLFRPPGLPGLYIRFRADPEGTVVELEEPGAPPLVLPRVEGGEPIVPGGEGR